jgi:flagellar biosynthesis protein FliQ
MEIITHYTTSIMELPTHILIIAIVGGIVVGCVVAKLRINNEK